MFDFYRLKKVKENANRIKRCDSKEITKKRKLRDPLDLDKKVLIRAERISKKDAPINIYKSTMENISFFNR